LGEDELAQGKVKIKRNGLGPEHPAKEGELVNLSDLVSEVRRRIKREAEIDSLAIHAEGLKVVGGSKEEAAKTGDDVPEPEKPAEETPLSQEAIGAVPAS
jgi:histidyl-tRNA synthetase